VVERCLREARIGFLHAAKLHPAMKHAAGARRLLGRRTIFNLPGPLMNPAGVKRQLVGVARRSLVTPMAIALKDLGARRAFVVHGWDGRCDLSVTGPSTCVELGDGELTARLVHPADFGLTVAELTELSADSPEASAAAIRAVLAGERGPRWNHTLLNAAAALAVAGVACDLAEGRARAADAINRGAARVTLDRLAAISRGQA